jgi:hypothetical protein
MEVRLLRSRVCDFLLQCLTLGSPPARVVVIGAAVIFLSTVNMESLKIPELCVWERIFGWCPARGTTHALNAFFHGDWDSAIQFNLNIVLFIPVIATMLFIDIVRVVKQVAGRSGKRVI